MGKTGSKSNHYFAILVDFGCNRSKFRRITCERKKKDSFILGMFIQDPCSNSMEIIFFQHKQEYYKHLRVILPIQKMNDA